MGVSGDSKIIVTRTLVREQIWITWLLMGYRRLEIYEEEHLQISKQPLLQIPYSWQD